MGNENTIEDLDVTNADEVKGAGSIAPPDLSKHGIVDTVRGARDNAQARAAGAEGKARDVLNAVATEQIDITPDRP